MTAIARWLALSPLAVQRIHAFIFDPASYLHPDRLPAYVPAALRGQAPDVVSRALLPGLGAAEELDLGLPAHRAALLPAEGLRRLALRVGACAEAGHLKRVVASSDIATLSDTLDAADWRAAYRSERCAARGTPQPSAAGLAAMIARMGWATLQAACDALPRGIGQRLLMKLPLADGTVALAPGAAMATVAAVYAEAVDDWEAGWDACFATPGR